MECQLRQHLLAAGGEGDEHLAAVFRAATTRDQALPHQPVHQFDSAVMLYLQALGEVHDARLFMTGFALDGEHQLMLLRLDADAPGGLFTEALKTADLVAKLGQSLVIGAGKPVVIHSTIRLYRIATYKDSG